MREDISKVIFPQKYLEICKDKMYKNIVQFTCQCGDKIGQFSCDNGTPIPHIKEMLLFFVKEIGKLEDELKKQQEEAEKNVKIEKIPSEEDES